jgi:hypothetical protein
MGHAGFDIGGLVIFLDHGDAIMGKNALEHDPDKREPVFPPGQGRGACP